MVKLKEVKAQEGIRTVTSNNFLKATGLENTSLKARKLLYIAMSQCRIQDKGFYVYSIKVSDFAQLMEISPTHVYEEADSITDELMKGFIKFVPEGKKQFKKFQLFERCEYTEDAIINFEMSKDMTPILLNIQGDFTQPLLNDFLKMNSNYSIEIWHLMQREMKSKKPGVRNTITFDLSLEELRHVTGTQKKLKQLSEFKNRVLNKAIREIYDNCGVDIKYTNIKTGRTVTGFCFTAMNIIYVPDRDVPKHLKDRARLGKLRIDEKNRNLTPEEQEEYDLLTANIEQMELKF
ncbi:MAG TPA: replication initiation protein [Chitinispirillaceae bacterium]|nr:replication initiation protein [Chitinispirillaceae bacterium]